MPDDSYRTIKESAQRELKVKGSRFIAETFAVTTTDKALEKLAEVRAREHQATHHCFAYLVGAPVVEAFKYSDDGEPNGTAGKPIYDVLDGGGLTNVLCVVTRYFGGTKLGTGGLVRAYSEAAQEAVRASGSRECYLTDELKLTLEFNLYDRWLREVHALGATVVDSAFTDTITMQVRIRVSLTEKLLASFKEITSGKGSVEKV